MIKQNLREEVRIHSNRKHNFLGMGHKEAACLKGIDRGGCGRPKKHCFLGHSGSLPYKASFQSLQVRDKLELRLNAKRSITNEVSRGVQQPCWD